MDQNTTCPKCGGGLEEGFIRDATGAKISVPPTWYKGSTQQSFWEGVKTSGLSHYQIRTYRCKQCGFLESYALEQDILTD